MGAGPRVSVIIPTYNRAALMREAVLSVLKQSWRDFEIIVADDGSTDDTPDVARELRDSIRYIRHANCGVNATRNRAIAESRGEYIALLDSDDLWEPFKLELQVGVLDALKDVGFTYSDFFILRDGGSVKPRGIATWHEDPDAWRAVLASRHSFEAMGIGVAAQAADRAAYVGDIHHLSLFEPYVLPSASLFRRKAVGADLRLTETDSTCGDWEFFARLSRRSGAAYTPIETTFNRSHEDEVRLTRISHAVQTNRRIAMIDRLWRADAEYMRAHTAEVDRVQRGLFLSLGLMHLMSSQRAQARECYASAARLGGTALPPLHRLARWLAYVPGTGAMLNLLRSLRNLARA